jgi:hypothetical protein
MLEYEHIVEVPCGDERHRLGVRRTDDKQETFTPRHYDVDVLDHDLEMVEGFVAFGAKAPLCRRLAVLIEGAINSYWGTPDWSRVDWETHIGGYLLDIDGWTAEEISEHIEHVVTRDSMATEDMIDDWEEAYRYATSIEERAAASNLAAEKAYKALLRGDFDEAMSKVTDAESQAMHGDNSDHWESFAEWIEAIIMELDAQ